MASGPPARSGQGFGRSAGWPEQFWIRSFPWTKGWDFKIPSGKLSHNYGKSSFLMGTVNQLFLWPWWMILVSNIYWMTGPKNDPKWIWECRFRMCLCWSQFSIRLHIRYIATDVTLWQHMESTSCSLVDELKSTMANGYSHHSTTVLVTRRDKLAVSRPMERLWICFHRREGLSWGLPQGEQVDTASASEALAKTLDG